MLEPAHIEHSADGTVVTGTARGDRQLIDLLKANGFRWSRRLEAWYLPRTWREATRRVRVDAVLAGAGELVELVEVDQPRRCAADRETERRARAAERADRLETRADRSAAEEERRWRAFRQLGDGIPFGQPVLVGHHSETRHRRHLARMDAHLEASYRAGQKAEAARAAADHARFVATGQESVVTIGNRLARAEAEQRRLRRRLDGTGQRIHGEDHPAEGTYRHRLLVRLAELDDELAYDRGKLEAVGGVVYGRDNVRPGDFVRIREQWYPVVRANLKSVSVPNALMPASVLSTQRSPWREVTEHLARAGADPETVVGLAAQCSAGFPGLRERLLREAEGVGAELAERVGQEDDRR